MIRWITLRRLGTAVLMSLAILAQGTWALAGTTGGLSGTLTDQQGKPIASASVAATSPSQAASTTTDANGRFTFVSLLPDSYVVTASKTGYDPVTISGVSIFADNTFSISMRTQQSLQTIANVTSRAAGSLVKPGTTADVYSVNAATQTALKGLSGGRNLDSAYSAIYNTPGVQSLPGNYGFGQVFYIRGSAYSQVGYEFDGVPVNRAFDNYNANSLSSLGQQELQVYTGGTPSGASSATLSGFINQVIRTGTYPGFGSAIVALGGPAFYHNGLVEAGGASPNRNFSYYVGMQGWNGAYHAINNKDGGDLSVSGQDKYGLLSGNVNGVVGLFATTYANGPFAACDASGNIPAGAADFQGLPNCTAFAPFVGASNSYIQDRENILNLHFGLPHKNDNLRDDIQVLYDVSSYHSAFANSVNDLGNAQQLNGWFNGYGGATGIASLLGISGYPGQGGPYDNYCAGLATLFAFGLATANCVPGNQPVPYKDAVIWPSGTSFGQSAAGLGPSTYFYPGSSTNRAPNSAISNTQRDTIWNDSGIVKLQYQKNFNANSFARAYGYSFYSDWLQNGPMFGTFGYNTLLAPASGFSVAAPDYELSTHTRGGELQYVNQLNAQNLVRATANYTTASVVRWNNSGSFLTTPTSASTTLADTNGQCYSYRANTLNAAGNPRDPNYVLGLPAGSPVNCFSPIAQGTFADPTRAAFPISGAAATAGAQFIVTVPGGSGTLNKIHPVFTSYALEDEVRPNDKLQANIGVRLEQYRYNFVNLNDAADNFWFGAAAKTYCYDPTTGLPVLLPTGPTTAPGSLTPVTASTGPVDGQCYQADPSTGFTTLRPVLAPSGAVALHPDGQSGRLGFTNVGPASVTKTVLSPRIGATFTVNPDTVLRLSAGKYSQPTETAFEQYYNESAKSATSFDYSRFFGIGFTTPVHDNPVQVSYNYDFSLEKRLKGTDITFKLSPFYRDTRNQIVSVTLGPNFVSGVNVGTQHSSGVEFQVSKGDPSRDGWSGSLSYSYVKAQMKYGNIGPLGRNAMDAVNDYITAFNKLTSAGGGSPCYDPGRVAPDAPGGVGNLGVSCSDPTAPSRYIVNPYYNMAAQPLLDRNGYFEVYPNAPPGGPINGFGGSGITAFGNQQITGFLSYRHQRLQVTPTFAVYQGAKYGSPTEIIGVDPRNCTSNQLNGGRVGASSAQANLADYQSCAFSPYTPNGFLAIPNPYSGTFDNIGQYREPWLFNLSAQLSYDFSPKVKGTLLLTNLVNRCFGGDKPAWAQAFPANNVVCGYWGNTPYFIGTPNPAGGMTNGAGFFYGASPHDPANGTAGYPHPYDYPYAPVTAGIPFQAYFSLNIKL